MPDREPVSPDELRNKANLLVVPSEGEYEVVDLLRAAADRIEELEHWLPVEEYEQAKVRIEELTEGLERLGSQQSFTGAFDAHHAPADVIWRELQARSRYALQVLGRDV